MQYNTDINRNPFGELWFDVERGCNTTNIKEHPRNDLLWFDVERGCNTTLQNQL